MEEEIIIPEQRPQPRLAILTASEYFALNNAISLAKGYALGDNTARFSTMNPELCKINIAYVDEVETFNLACVMPITVEVQELMPELELVDKYVSAGINLTEIIVTDATTSQVDWDLMHYNAVGDKTADYLWLETEPPSELSEEALNELALVMPVIVVE